VLSHEFLASDCLGRTVALHIHVPDDVPDDALPVLYMYDGGVVFREENGGFGYESYQRAHAASLPRIVLVGIDPPEGRWARTAEFAPYTKAFDTHGADFEPVVHGRGSALLDFVFRELKPWVDRSFPADPSPEHTALGGMSSGALNAMYAAMCRGGDFSRLLLHGPAFNLWLPELLKTAKGTNFSRLRYCYMDIGDEDATRMSTKEQTMKSALRMKDTLLSGGMDEAGLRFRVIPGGRHAPDTWRNTFPDALRWIFQDNGGTKP